MKFKSFIIPAAATLFAVFILSGCATVKKSPEKSSGTITISEKEYKDLLLRADSRYVVIPRHVYDSITERNRILEDLVVSLRSRLLEYVEEH